MINAFFKRAAWIQHAFRFIFLIGYLALMHGCAVSQETYHQLRYCNMGSLALTSVRIEYGDVIWPLTPEGRLRRADPPCVSGGVSTSGPMRVPVTMQVFWSTEDNRSHSAAIPIKSKLNRNFPVNTIQVQFSNDQVEVIERVYETPAKRVDFKIYP
jgi:hypothetical protein